MIRRLLIMALAMSLLLGCSGKILTDEEILKNRNTIIQNVREQKQSEDYACGIASLTSILNYWGKTNSNESSILKEFPPSSDIGYSLVELKNIAKSNGLEAFILKGDLDFLKEQVLLGRPLLVPIWISDGWIVAFNQLEILGGARNHYVVVYGFFEDKFVVMDPDKGVRSITTKKFQKMWEVNKKTILLIAKME